MIRWFILTSIAIFLYSISGCEDYPPGKVTIKNASDKVITVEMTAHLATEKTEELVLKPGQSKKYEFDRILTEIVLSVQAWEDYDAGKPLGIKVTRGFEIVRDDDRVILIKLDGDRIYFEFRSFHSGIFRP